MQQAYPDPFGAYAQKDGEIFSILSPLAILGPSAALTKTSTITPPKPDLSTTVKSEIVQPEAESSAQATDDTEDAATPTKPTRKSRQLSIINEDSKAWAEQSNAEERLNGWLADNQSPPPMAESQTEGKDDT